MEGAGAAGAQGADRERLEFGDGELRAEVVAHGEFGERTLRFAPVEDFLGVVERLGHMPLPPYIHREDRRGRSGAVPDGVCAGAGVGGGADGGIALYAGDPGRDSGAGRGDCFCDAARGAGDVSAGAGGAGGRCAAACGAVHDFGGDGGGIERGTARGAADCGGGNDDGADFGALRCGADGEFAAHSGSTSIFISPGFEFRVVGALLTNFHLPQSTLLMLVSAFAGRERVLAAYRHAVEARYRFFSYGDCMFIE